MPVHFYVHLPKLCNTDVWYVRTILGNGYKLKLERIIEHVMLMSKRIIEHVMHMSKRIIQHVMHTCDMNNAEEYRGAKTKKDYWACHSLNQYARTLLGSGQRLNLKRIIEHAICYVRTMLGSGQEQKLKIIYIIHLNICLYSITDLPKFPGSFNIRYLF